MKKVYKVSWIDKIDEYVDNKNVFIKYSWLYIKMVIGLFILGLVAFVPFGLVIFIPSMTNMNQDASSFYWYFIRTLFYILILGLLISALIVSLREAKQKGELFKIGNIILMLVLAFLLLYPGVKTIQRPYNLMLDLINKKSYEIELHDAEAIKRSSGRYKATSYYISGRIKRTTQKKIKGGKDKKIEIEIPYIDVDKLNLDLKKHQNIVIVEVYENTRIYKSRRYTDYYEN